jgi:hypothetical protein
LSPLPSAALASIVLMLSLGPARAATDVQNLRALATRLKDDLAIVDFRIAPETHTLDLDLGVLSPADADLLIEDVCGEAMQSFTWTEEWTIRGFPMAWSDPAAECSTE